MNALDLVNEAIREAGIQLDSLSSSNYTTPTEAMHTKFKNWVNQSWKEIQLERLEWEFMSRNGMVTISPRLFVELGDRSIAPPAGSEFVCESTEATFTVLSTSLLDGTWAGGDAVAYIDYEDLDGQFKFDEYVNEVSPTPANTDVFKIRDWGRYDLASIYTDLEEANIGAFYIQSTGSSTTQDNTNAFDLTKLVFVPWSIWKDNYEEAYGSFGTPIFYTITPNGHYDFFPRPDKQYVIKFDYSAEPQAFSAYSDTPEGLPSHLHEIIVWRAVMFYAQYERAQDIEVRARKRYKFYKRILDRQYKPHFTFPRNKFNG
jgi:hypothetical protein